MKKVLFATGNPSKAKRFRKGLLEHGIEVVTLKDLNIELDVLEDGKDQIENACKKAKACYEKVKMPIIGMDDSLYMENVPEEMQPGLYVRRVGGKTLNDSEMIDHYTNLVKQYGVDGKIPCKWIYGLAVINEEGTLSTYTWEKSDFYMVAEKSEKINPGYPLNSISKYKKTNKYFTETTEEEKNSMKINEEDVVGFIRNHIG